MSQATWQDGVLSSLSRVGQRQGLASLAERFRDLTQWLGADYAAVEHTLAGLLTRAHDGELSADERSLAERAAAHLLALPGKRVRPLCVMLAARLGAEADPNAVRDVAVAAELVHAATLLHDDVIDEGTERRGSPAARTVFGNSASILGGDHLLITALRSVRRVGRADLLDSLLDTIGEMVEAEALQLERRGRLEATREDYLRVIRGKTAALFRWGLHAGGSLAGLEPSALGALEEAGLALGMAFQLVDDLLDLRGDPLVTGKNALADLREGKITWPFIIACERDPEVAELLAALVANPEEDPAQVRHLVARVVETGGADATRDFAMEQRDLAEKALDRLPAGTARQALRWVVQFAVERAS